MSFIPEAAPEIAGGAEAADAALAGEEAGGMSLGQASALSADALASAWGISNGASASGFSKGGRAHIELGGERVPLREPEATQDDID